MEGLYGLHCANPKCVHDSVRAYRLRFMVRPNELCMFCQRPGVRLTPEEAATAQALDLDDPDTHERCVGWLKCPLPTQCDKPWRQVWQPERNDMVFRAKQLDSALGQMEVLGVSNPKLGAHVVFNHHSLPPGFDQRLLMLTEEALRKFALYLRWRPERGEILRPDMCLQGMFGPGATAEQRRTAQVRPFLPDEFTELLQGFRPTKSGGRTVIESFSRSKIKCQHCQHALPLRAFNTQSLHEANWGD